jgi:hypothetical protein
MIQQEFWKRSTDFGARRFSGKAAWKSVFLNNSHPGLMRFLVWVFIPEQ